VAFPPPPVTSPATRLTGVSEETSERLSTLWLIISIGRRRFLNDVGSGFVAIATVPVMLFTQVVVAFVATTEYVPLVV